ncbi:MAG: DUF1345 domain-containing protein [Acetobacteraceae bacterium]|nr:DUF1345 domain-containing protein [Acetobacteraceae bacterium]
MSGAAATWPVRVVAGHRYTFSACLIGVFALLLLPGRLGWAARAVCAWDIGAISLLALFATILLSEGDDERMARNAAAQQEGEWTVFGITLLGVVVSFAALTHVLGLAKDMQGLERKLYIATVAATLFLSWLVTQVVFALRYAHEYYERPVGASRVDGGLEFPGGLPPDYWDFLYFAMVLGMTFQVSDVQITSRKLRRLAVAHGLIGFLFNAVIIALTVNIAASLL